LGLQWRNRQQQSAHLACAAEADALGRVRRGQRKNPDGMQLRKPSARPGVIRGYGRSRATADAAQHAERRRTQNGERQRNPAGNEMIVNSRRSSAEQRPQTVHQAARVHAIPKLP
jgi:hypothetical protein